MIHVIVQETKFLPVNHLIEKVIVGIFGIPIHSLSPFLFLFIDFLAQLGDTSVI